jgi:hypothetical protein
MFLGVIEGPSIEAMGKRGQGLRAGNRKVVSGDANPGLEMENLGTGSKPNYTKSKFFVWRTPAPASSSDARVQIQTPTNPNLNLNQKIESDLLLQKRKEPAQTASQ